MIPIIPHKHLFVEGIKIGTIRRQFLFIENILGHLIYLKFNDDLSSRYIMRIKVKQEMCVKHYAS